LREVAAVTLALSKGSKTSGGMQWRRGLRTNLFVTALFVLVLSVLGSLGSLMIAYNAVDYPIIGATFAGVPFLWQWFFGAFLGSAFTLIALFLFRFSDDLVDVLFAKSALKRIVVAAFLIFLFVFAILVYDAFLYVNQNPDSSNYSLSLAVSFFSYVVKNAGGIVGFFATIITITAFTLTIQQLKDLRSTVSSFSDLATRLSKLGSECTADDPLHVVSYTPCLGYLALPREKWNLIYKTFIRQDKSGQSTTRMIVLQDDQLRQWHSEFLGRTTRHGVIDQRILKDNEEQAIRIKNVLKAMSPADYMEIDRVSLPGYYCFFNASRAIVVAPFFLPISGQHEDDRKHLPNPNMVGYETTDRTTVEYLHDQFHYLERSAH
jgi:hypothetical protein